MSTKQLAMSLPEDAWHEIAWAKARTKTSPPVSLLFEFDLPIATIGVRRLMPKNGFRVANEKSSGKLYDTVKLVVLSDDCATITSC